MINRKQKGTNAERELLQLLWIKGYAGTRTAGSGNASYPLPDLLMGKNGNILAIEVKTIDDEKYFSDREITDLDIFAKIFGATPCIFVKAAYKGWYFMETKDLEKTKKGYSFKLTSANVKKIEELL